jgi:hypothetical protein
MALAFSFVVGLAGPVAVFAATAPSLGTASSYGVAATTFTNSNTAPKTVINGSECATTQPTTVPLAISGSTVTPCDPQVGIDQTAALNNAIDGLNTQACTPISGALDTVIIGSNPAGTFPPGCYAETGAMNIALSANVTLDLTAPSGTGNAWIFTSTGALTTGNNSSITLAHGANPNNVFWAPVGLATIGAYTTGGVPAATPTFVGNILDAAGITIGHFANLQGRALAFGGTVTTDANTISVPGAPVAATLNVVKLVVGGTAAPSDFNVYVKNAGTNVAGSPAAGTSTPGTPYALSPGTYTISEDANSSYAQSFQIVGVGGDCDASGSITLAAGDNKTCTIVNSNIPALVTPPAPVVSSGGGGGVIVPLIGITKIPTPLALSVGSSSVTYNYTVWNVGGQQPLTGVTVADDKCASVSYVSGDVNSNNQLDPHEIWKYSCTMTLASTTTNTAIATGHTGGQTAVATAVATVVVASTSTVPGLPNTGLVAPIINILKVPSRLIPFPFGGGNVTYTYTVTNPGVVAMNNVNVTDNKCAPVSYAAGDTNSNGLLDPGEVWTYTCTTNVPVSTTNIATAKGSANGMTAISYAFSTVLVAAPGLPNTGFPPVNNGIAWSIIAAGFLLAISISLAMILKKRKI